MNLVLTWPVDCVILSNPVTNQETTFATTDTKRYFSVVTLSTQDNEKLLKQVNQDWQAKFSGMYTN